MTYGVASFLSTPKCICNHERGKKCKSWRGPKDYHLFLKMSTLNRQRQASWHLSPPRAKPLCSHMGGWNNPVHSNTLTLFGWTIGGRVHQKSSVKEVTQTSIIHALDNFTSDLPRIPGWGVGFQPTLKVYIHYVLVVWVWHEYLLPLRRNLPTWCWGR